MDDPYPGSFVAAVWLAWGLGLLVFLSGIASVLFSYFYVLLNNFSQAKLLQMASGDAAKERISRYLENLPRTTNTVVVVEIAAKILFMLAAYALVSGAAADSAGPRLLPFVWTFLIALVWLAFLCRTLSAELGSRKQEGALLKVLPLLNGLGVAFLPLHVFLSAFRTWVLKKFRPSNPDEEVEHFTEEIIDVVDQGEREGAIRTDVAEMIENIVELHDSEVAEIMVPRTDMTAVDVRTPLREAVKLAMNVGHSRIPVYRGAPDQIVGVLYLKDVVKHWLHPGEKEAALEEIVRKPYFVPETKKISELLHEFRQHKVHMAIVLDEYGGTAGVVTNEDILEEIVGEILDEYDSEEDAEVRVVDDRTLDVSARAHIYDLNKEWGTTIPESDDFETVGGYIFAALGKVPAKGEAVVAGNARLIVTDATDRRVKRVTVKIEAGG